MDEHRNMVYQALFYHNKVWPHEGPTIFFYGERIHYSEFMKAKRGAL